MKAAIFSFLMSVLCILTSAQAPQSFKYQAVARDMSGNVLSVKTVSFKISILSGSPAGTVAYSETHSGKVTNAFGLVDFEIGKGIPVSGTFATVSWGTNSYYMKVEMDPNNGSAWQAMGTSQLLSVPYALYARDVQNNDDADNSITNEIQALSILGNQLTLSKGGGTVTLPGATGGDDWGTQSVVTDATLAGNGTQATPLKVADNAINSAKIADGTIVTADLADMTVSTAKLGNLAVSAEKIQAGAVTTEKLANSAVTTEKIGSGAVTGIKIAQTGATTGQVLKWNGVTWAPANDESGTGGSNPTGPAGGDLSGQYPNPSIAADAVVSSKILDGAILSADIAANTISSAKILDGTINTADLANSAITMEKISDAAVTGPKIASMGANLGSVLKWNGTVWAPSTDESGLTLPYVGVASTNVGFFVQNDHGFAIEGKIVGTSGSGTAIYGSTNTTDGRGIWGLASSTTGTNYGVYAESKANNGFGVKALASSTTGSTYGIWATSKSSSGYGVIGDNESATGTTFGVRGSVLSSSGYSGYFVGGRFYVAGNVGIGASSPSAGLHLKGNGFPDSFMYLEAAAAQDAGFRIYEGTTAKWHIFNNAGLGGLQIYNNLAATGIFIKQANAFVGIGTTAPSQKLDVDGNLRVRSIGSGAYAGVVNRMTDGTLTTATSDGRLKENIRPLQNSLDKVMQLQGVSFTWKSNPEYGRRIGFIAQEFEKVIPELVFTNPTDGYKGINYAEISAVLVESVKQLKAENDFLKSENADLRKGVAVHQSQIESMESRIERIEQLLEAISSK